MTRTSDRSYAIPILICAWILTGLLITLLTVPLMDFYLKDASRMMFLNVLSAIGLGLLITGTFLGIPIFLYIVVDSYFTWSKWKKQVKKYG